MKYLLSVISFIVALATSSAIAGSSYTVENNDRIAYVVGPIGESSIAIAHQIERASAKSREPIHVIINSPGGMILAGYQIIQAMNIARNRGSEVVCVVATMAASMAFQLLPHCDRRYALKKSLLLFHPAHVSLQGSINADEALSIAEDLRRMDRAANYEIKSMMGVPSDEWFDFHNKNETMWTAEFLLEETTNRWLEIVDEITTPQGIFNMDAGPQTNRTLDLNDLPWLRHNIDHEIR